MAISGVGRVEISGGLWVEGNNIALELDPEKDLDNGHVHLDLGEQPSQSPGWRARGKLRHRGRLLSDGEIDALVVKFMEPEDG